MSREGRKVTRAQFDIGPLLAAGFASNIETAAPVVSSRLIERLPRAPWKGGE